MRLPSCKVGFVDFYIWRFGRFIDRVYRIPIDGFWLIYLKIYRHINWPANEGKPNRYRYHVMNWQCYSARAQLHVMYMITYWLPLTCYLLVCSVSSHTAAIETKLMSQHSFTLYIIAMQHSKRHNSEILCLHPGRGGVDSETVKCELFRVELLYISLLRSDWQLRLFMYNFNCISFIIWERLDKYIPYGYK